MMTSSSKAIAACALLIVACIGTLSFWSEVRNDKDRAWVTHTMFVVEKMQAIRSDIDQAVAGQRGYVLTGDDIYLEPYSDGLNQVGRDVEELRNLTSDNPRQQEAIRQLEQLIALRLAKLADGIEERRRNGLLAGADVVSKGNMGEQLMRRISVQLVEMRGTEGQLLSKRLKTAAASCRNMKILVVCGNTVAILILLVKGFVIHRETGKRNLAEGRLKQANVRLERSALELSETNVELESFAYSVAHDLRAPLRHIAGYSNALVQSHGPSLDAEGQRYLAKISDGAQKMGHLVDDLLSLSKVGQQELSLEKTALDAVVRHVVNDLMPEALAREVEWQIGDLCSVECDPGLIHQVFVNLLSNALKYTGKRKHAVIEVGQTMQLGRRVFFVRDNGVGFEMQYAGKLFGVFQRLHKAKDFEGTGVGLAIVQRIIRKHGGQIWAEAELDKGATFFFTLGTPDINPATEPAVTLKAKAMHV
jgi:signal transduction histidine kinase